MKHLLHSGYTLIELMVVIALIGIVVTLFQYDGISQQKALQNSQRISRSIEGILQSARLNATLGKVEIPYILNLSTGSIAASGNILLQTPFFDNDSRYIIEDILVASGSSPISFSGGLDIIYRANGELSFSGTQGSNDAKSSTGLIIRAGYQGARSYDVMLDRRNGIVTIDK